MLVLGRFRGQRVLVDGGSLIVSVESIRWNKERREYQVRLGFEAPPEIEIHREEIQERIDAERLEPAEAVTDMGEDE